MAAFDTSNLSNDTCKKCGAIYSVQYQSLPIKDKDSFICSCGEVLKSWKETGMYIYELIKETK